MGSYNIWSVGTQIEKGHQVSLHRVPTYLLLVEDLVGSPLMWLACRPGLSFCYSIANRVLLWVDRKGFQNEVMTFQVDDDQFRVLAPDLAFLLDDDE